MARGQSGAPVFLEGGYAIGVNTREYTFLSLNEANRVNELMFNTAAKVVSDNS